MITPTWTEGLCIVFLRRFAGFHIVHKKYSLDHIITSIYSAGFLRCYPFNYKQMITQESSVLAHTGKNQPLIPIFCCLWTECAFSLATEEHIKNPKTLPFIPDRLINPPQHANRNPVPPHSVCDPAWSPEPRWGERSVVLCSLTILERKCSDL